jgi:hypothetical protein
MATVNKDFRVKNGLVVEGTTGTINGAGILTEANDTDNLSEGTNNLYFTTERAEDAAGALLANAIKENIVISYDSGTNQLTVTAENGVDDSDTDDLDEGLTNLYFTDQRAIDAVKNSDIDTDDIDEGASNLYFTNQRALDATDGTYAKLAGATFTGEVILAANPTNALGAATKQYVDEVAEGLHAIPSAEALADSNIAGTFNSANNTITAASNVVFPAIDGVTISVGDNVLLIGQTNAWENGSYVLTDAGEDGVSPWVLTRCEFCNETSEIAGAYEFVTGGTTYGGTGWVATVPAGFTLNATDGSGDITWIQFSGAGTYTAGTGLALNGTEFSLDADTDDVAEGVTNLYFTDERAQDAVATAIANGTHTNITITYNDEANSLSFAGSSPISTTDDLTEGVTNLYFTDQRAIDAVVNGAVDTDDIEEGVTNLYFTNQRAVDALEAVTPDFQEIDINSITKTFAVTSTVATAEVATQAYTFAHATYRSAKMTVKFAFGTHTEISEVLLTMDTSDNIAITEYAIVQTNGSLGSVTAVLDGTDVDINVAVPNASTTVTIFGTLIA